MLVTSPFGNRRDPMNHSKTQFHKGIDISCKNETLLATENNGKVVGVNHNANTGGGKSVTIEYNREDGSKYQTTYMHMSSIDVSVGDTVNGETREPGQLAHICISRSRPLQLTARNATSTLQHTLQR